jgi:hypothetical protein
LSLLPAVLLLLPLSSATNNKINIAAPITQTHGEVYQSVVCFVETLVVVLLELDVESCACNANCIKLKTNKIIKDFRTTSFFKFFIFFVFLLNRANAIYSSFNNYASPAFFRTCRAGIEQFKQLQKKATAGCSLFDFHKKKRPLSKPLL